jgi:hypothetical protein
LPASGAVDGPQTHRPQHEADGPQITASPQLALSGPGVAHCAAAVADAAAPPVTVAPCVWFIVSQLGGNPVEHPPSEAAATGGSNASARTTRSA